MNRVCVVLAVLLLVGPILSLNAEEPQLVTIQSPRLAVSISPIGAELQSVASREPEHEFLWHGDPEFWDGRAPIMFPVNVKFKNNQFTHDEQTYEMPLLGIVKSGRFKVLPSASEDKVELELESNDQTLRHYPFSFKFRAKFSIEDRSLNVNYVVENTGDETMYFALGSHPGFAAPVVGERKKGDYELHFSKSLTLERVDIVGGLLQDKMIPYLRNENTLKLDDARVPSSGMLITNCEARQIGVALVGRPPYAVLDLGTFPNVNIWTPPSKPFVCIEPMVTHHDQQDSPMAISEKKYLLSMDAGQQMEFQYSIHVHPENWTDPAEQNQAVGSEGATKSEYMTPAVAPAK